MADAADRDGAAAVRRRSQPAMPTLAPQQQVDAGGAGHATEHLDYARVQPADAGLRAQRLRRRHDAEKVDRSRSDHGAARGKISGPAAAGGRSGRCLQGRVGPVQLADLSRRAPGQVLLAGLGEQVVAYVVQAPGQEEAGCVFGDQGLVPGPPALGGLVPGGVEGQGGGAEVARRPGPLGLEQPQQVQEIVRRVRGAGGQPPGRLVQFGQQAGPFVAIRGAGLPGQGQPAQQAG
jgi:hypothetical protein